VIAGTGSNVARIYKDNWPEGFTEFTLRKVAGTSDILISRYGRALDEALSGPGLTEAQIKANADRDQFGLRDSSVDFLPHAI
jgi:hypothetical protein